MSTSPEFWKDRSPGSFGELLHVAVPLILSSGSLSLMHVIDRMFLTWYSHDALAAALPAGLMYWTVISTAMGIAMYVNTFVAQYEGANQREKVAAALWQGLYLSLLAGSVLIVCVPLSTSLFALIGHSPGVQRLEVKYFSVLCCGSMPMLMTAVLSCFFSGRGKTLVVMWVNLCGVFVNVVLDYCLIFGFGPLPQWGIFGAAVATVTANISTMLLYAWLITRKETLREYQVLENRRLDFALFERMLRFGLPNGIQIFVDIGAFSLFIILVGKLGTNQLAATNLAFNLNTLAFVPMLGMGTAVMTLVGKRIGEGKPELAVRTTWTAFWISSVYMVGFAIVYVLLPDLILAPYGAYTDDGEFEVIRKQVIVLLRFVAVYSFFDAMVIVFGSAIRGAGDTRFSLMFVMLTSWSLMVLPTFLAWVYLGGSLAISWSACTVYIVILGLGFLVRFRAGQWKSMRVIEQV